MATPSPIAIIGNGAAAVHAIQALRESGFSGTIHLLADSVWPAYNPMLTTYFVAGKIPLERCFPFGIGWDLYRKYDVHLHLGSPVVELDAEAQTLRTAAGERLHYGSSLVASGASPLVPAGVGPTGERICTMRSLEDALRLKRALEGPDVPRRALVVGASMVGIKLVELFHQAGLGVCLADLAPQVFPLAAHPDCAGIIHSYLESKGIRLRLGAGIEGIEAAAAGIEAYFSDGGPPEQADLAVISTGIRSNLQFLDAAQVRIHKGILVDDHLRTSAPNLYAAGDVAQATNLLTGQKEIIALWAHACHQGRTAGRNLAGKDDTYPGSIPANITHFWDVSFVGIGDPQPGPGRREEKRQRGRARLYLVWEGDRLVGVNLLNDFQAAGLWKQLIARGSPPSSGGLARGDILGALLKNITWRDEW